MCFQRVNSDAIDCSAGVTGIDEGRNRCFDVLQDSESMASPADEFSLTVFLI